MLHESDASLLTLPVSDLTVIEDRIQQVLEQMHP